MEQKKGGISVDTEHIFPVIKRWLYSDKDIFLRELVSNANDAITKMKRLESLGKAENSLEYRIDVILDKELSEIKVIDNGIGMTGDEISKYINQIALSGALEFIEKYEGENSEGGGIIGHFGLGFYSAFMVAGRVDINSLSFAENAESAFWTSDDTGEYEMREGTRKERGTEITLHISEEEKEYLSREKLLPILKKYCSFMPCPIYFTEVGKPEENKDPVNDPKPLWLSSPSELKDEDYIKFYHKVFQDASDPLFWVHINAEYPLNFKGIIYFPKIIDEYASLEGQVKLFYNQVFVADNIKEVIPEYLMLLKGVIDCPELPLNVSRSYLQSNGYVEKISNHIVKKITDKLNSLFNNDRKKYEENWDDIKPFAEYGSTRDPKFFDKIKKIIMYKTVSGEYFTLEEYLEKNKGKGKENTVYYSSDVARQISYINLYKAEGIEVCDFSGVIDTRFISFYEYTEKNVHFVRCDSELDEVLVGDEKYEENEELTKLFKSVVPEKVEIKQETMKSDKTPAIITLSEEKRRLGELIRQYSGNLKGLDAPEDEVTLVINMHCPLIARIGKLAEDPSKLEKAKKLAKQVYMIAVISERNFSEEELREFIDSSVDLLYNA